MAGNRLLRSGQTQPRPRPTNVCVHPDLRRLRPHRPLGNIRRRPALVSPAVALLFAGSSMAAIDRGPIGRRIGPATAADLRPRSASGEQVVGRCPSRVVEAQSSRGVAPRARIRRLPAPHDHLETVVRPSRGHLPSRGLFWGHVFRMKRACHCCSSEPRRQSQIDQERYGSPWTHCRADGHGMDFLPRARCNFARLS